MRHLTSHNKIDICFRAFLFSVAVVVMKQNACWAQAKLVIKQNNARPQIPFPEYICVCLFQQNIRKIFEVAFPRLWAGKREEVRFKGKKKGKCCRFVEAIYIVMCSKIRCQIYFSKKLFICSFNHICLLFWTFFLAHATTSTQVVQFYILTCFPTKQVRDDVKISNLKRYQRISLKISKDTLKNIKDITKVLAITVFGRVDRRGSRKTDWRVEKEKHVVANTEIRIQFIKEKIFPKQTTDESGDEGNRVFQCCSLCKWRRKRVNYGEGVISKALVLPQHYFTWDRFSHW